MSKISLQALAHRFVILLDDIKKINLSVMFRLYAVMFTACFKRPSLTVLYLGHDISTCRKRLTTNCKSFLFPQFDSESSTENILKIP